MEALGVLAVAQRHILATLGQGSLRRLRPSAREPVSRVVPLRSTSGASRHARLALPVRQGGVCVIGY